MLLKLLDLFYPNTCLFCADSLVQGEQFLCVMCCNDMPVIPYKSGDCPPVSNQLKGKVDFENTYSLYYYNKFGKTGKLLKEIKYRGNRELGLHLGRLFGEQLKSNECIQNIDTIVPVPLHPRRLLKRGFNQAALIAIGMSEVLGIPENTDIFIRTRYNDSQTKKGRASRFDSTKGLFRLVKKGQIIDKHILLVDDVITTGATVESMFYAINGIGNVKISVGVLCSPYE